MTLRTAATVAFVGVLVLAAACAAASETKVTSDETRLFGDPQTLKAECVVSLALDDRYVEIVSASWDTEWFWPPREQIVGAATVLMVDGTRQLAACDYKGNGRFEITWMGER